MRIFDCYKMVEFSTTPEIKSKLGLSYVNYYPYVNAYFVQSVDDFIMKASSLSGKEIIAHTINLKSEISRAIETYFKKNPDDELPLDGEVFFSKEERSWAHYAHYGEYKCMMTITPDGMDFNWV